MTGHKSIDKLPVTLADLHAMPLVRRTELGIEVRRGAAGEQWEVTYNDSPGYHRVRLIGSTFVHWIKTAPGDGEKGGA